MKTFMIAVASLILAAKVEAQSLERLLDCSRYIRHDKEFSEGGRIRADQVFLCISQNGRRASLHYRAAALHNDKYVGRSNSPWLRLTLYSSSGAKLYQNPTFDLVDVERCGGYSGHWKTVPISARDVSKIDFIEISIGNTGPRSCGKSPGERFIYDVKKTATRWARGDLTETERKIVAIAQGGGF